MTVRKHPVWIGPPEPPLNVPKPILALFQALPPPGSEWPMLERLKWLQAMERLIDLFYRGDVEIVISASVPATDQTTQGSPP